MIIIGEFEFVDYEMGFSVFWIFINLLGKLWVFSCVEVGCFNFVMVFWLVVVVEGVIV